MKKNLSSKKRKSQILSIARTLFANNGYAETTLDTIANKAGVTRPRVIQLFGSKLDIYKAIAETAYKDHPIDKDLIELLAKKDDMAVFEAFAFHILYHTTKREEREIAQILMYARLKNDRFHRIHFKKKDSLMISRLSEYVRERIKERSF
jgi:AcrR family transcriptional regulator